MLFAIRVRELVFSLSLIISLFVQINGVSATSIGLAPETMDLTSLYGDVRPGQSYTYSLYFLMLEEREDITLRIQYVEPRYGQYWVPSETDVSEESIQDWISFSESEFLIPKEKQPEPADVPGTGGFVYNKKIDVIVTIPSDAEPGWHTGIFTLNPITDSKTGAPTLSIFSLPRPILRFRVEGDVRRDLEITNLRTEQESRQKVNLYFTITNVGTVSTRIRNDIPSTVTIYNTNNEPLGESKFGGLLIGPGETKEIAVPWQSEREISDGEYKGSVVADYRTGKAEYAASFITTSLSIPIGQAPPLQNVTETTLASSLNLCSVPLLAIIGIGALSALLVYVLKKQFRSALIIGIAAALLAGIGSYLLCVLNSTLIILLLVIGVIVFVLYRRRRHG